ncbi:hypothetical protein L208DRAFT_1548378 [Tricholoma matsutake]|nr:hypothetical protein L208DRAFT_1548378 [Tricholoma matsutake 945]
MMVQMAMGTRLTTNAEGEDVYDENQCSILKQLPTSLETTLNKFNIDGQTTTLATCPSCNYTHKPIYDPISATVHYPTHCANHIVGPDRSYICGTDLLEECSNCLQPLKPYVVPSFADYIARLLSDPEVEWICKQVCDDATATLKDPPKDMTNVFHAEFMKSFKGPIPGQLFIDRGDKVRLVFAMHVDFFNPNGTTKHGNHDSIGIISLANLNLPSSARYKPENIYLAIIPGPHEPSLEDHSTDHRRVRDWMEKGVSCFLYRFLFGGRSC